MSPEDMELERNRAPVENEDDSVQRKKNDSKKHTIDTESEPIVQKKRSFVNSLESEEQSQAERSRHNSLDVIRKKRRTSIGSDNTDSLQELPMPVEADNIPLPGDLDLPESEDIQVVFQDESEKTTLSNIGEDDDDFPMEIPDNSGVANTNRPANVVERPHRDHRVKIRRIFGVCFTENSQPNLELGRILAECSDEEE